jgi:MFS transporter, OPA family, glycerol-3-phosphate transporter
MSSILKFIDSPQGPLILVSVCLAVIIGLYFYNNPLAHDKNFMLRRFVNWFPLGMTYAFLYMGRYNLTVSKNAMGSLMTNSDFGWIFFFGTWTYALSFLINGPLVDKIGGKKGILIAAIGSSLANIALGVLTYLVVTNQLKMKMVTAFSLIYSLNMYFQSYGAVSIIKVKAYWFHVRERGVFGAIFGTLISFGVYFAFDWGKDIVDMTKVNPAGEVGWLHRLVQSIFASRTHAVDATWAVFFIPAAIMIFWALLDWWLIKDTPEEANFPYFDTADASSGKMHIEFSTMDLLKKVLTSPLMILISFVELTSGVFRNGIAQWYLTFTHDVKQPAAQFFVDHWGLLLCFFGIIGGFTGGLVSDRLFDSRRAPPAGLLCGAILILATLMAACLFSSPIIVGMAAVGIWMCGVGVTSLMSGTAATDFGGRKATATCSGIVDGFAYLGSGIQSLCIKFIVPEATGGAHQLVPLFGFSRGWQWWPIFLIPFAIMGIILAWKLWHELPAATRKYIDEVEQKPTVEITCQ